MSTVTAAYLDNKKAAMTVVSDRYYRKNMIMLLPESLSTLAFSG